MDALHAPTAGMPDTIFFIFALRCTTNMTQHANGRSIESAAHKLLLGYLTFETKSLSQTTPTRAIPFHGLETWKSMVSAENTFEEELPNDLISQVAGALRDLRNQTKQMGRLMHGRNGIFFLVWATYRASLLTTAATEDIEVMMTDLLAVIVTLTNDSNTTFNSVKDEMEYTNAVRTGAASEVIERLANGG